MAVRVWEPIKISFCQQTTCDVALEAQVIYPTEWMPEQAPRVNAHRCSKAVECIFEGKANCAWVGANPGFDPFSL